MRIPICLLTILTSLPVAWAQTDAPAEVTVPDAALRAVLEDSLGLAAGEPIPATELAELTDLEARDAGILDLTGLEHATGLTRLHLGPEVGEYYWDNSNDISDLSPLSGLTGLTRLNLAGNPVSDLTPLSRLTGLRYLNLQGCPISDASLSPLASLTGLTDLWLAFTGVMDAGSLSGLSGLTVHGISLPRRYPKLDSTLDHIVEQYEAALEAGRVTSRVGGGPCYLGDDASFVDFRDWDPSKPAPSIYVEVIVEVEAVELVRVLLEDHGIRYYVSYHYFEACVPVPLLVPLSELPGVYRIALVPPLESDSATLLEGASWGVIKDRLK